MYKNALEVTMVTYVFVESLILGDILSTPLFAESTMYMSTAAIRDTRINKYIM